MLNTGRYSRLPCDLPALAIGPALLQARCTSTPHDRATQKYAGISISRCVCVCVPHDRLLS